MHRIIGFALALSALGCQSAQQGEAQVAGGTSAAAGSTPSDSSVVVTLSAATYAPGAEVTVQLTNHTTDTLAYNPCADRVVERQQGNAWTAIPEPRRMCTMIARLLRPSETQTSTTDLPADLTRGTYRLVLSFSIQKPAPPGGTGAGTVHGTSPAFSVR